MTTATLDGATAGKAATKFSAYKIKGSRYAWPSFYRMKFSIDDTPAYEAITVRKPGRSRFFVISSPGVAPAYVVQDPAGQTAATFDATNTGVFDPRYIISSTDGSFSDIQIRGHAFNVDITINNTTYVTRLRGFRDTKVQLPGGEISLHFSLFRLNLQARVPAAVAEAIPPQAVSAILFYFYLCRIRWSAA